MNLLTIGGIPISVEASDTISQTYAPIGGRATIRMMDGAALRQKNWSRIKTTVSVSAARFLPALASLDLDVPQVIQCVAPRHIAGMSNAVSLPISRRTDVPPYGFATIANGFMVPTAGVLDGNTYTLAPVAGALRYTACYLPELTVLITDLAEHYDVRGAVAGWELTAEEV